MFHVFIHSLKSYNARFILKSSNTYKTISFEIFYIFYFKKEKKKLTNLIAIKNIHRNMI